MIDLIILGGGEARRMGGVDKLSVELRGRRLIDWLLDTPDTRPIVVAPATVSLPPQVLRTLEDPPLGGPVAGIAAALQLCDAPLVGIVAGDAPLAGRVIPTLVAALTPEVAGVLGRTPDGQVQQLLSVFHRDALISAVNRLDSPRDKSVRALYRELELSVVDVPAWVMDADRPEDLAELETLAP